MKNNPCPAKMLKYKTLLLEEQEDLARGLRNHRLVDSLGSVELLDGIQQPNITLHQFAADSEVLREIKSALERIAEGTFGVCDKCGERMPSRRLEAVPWARFCVSCQESFERGATEDAVNAQWFFSAGGTTRAIIGVPATL
jgi:DnaK suppressor protein